MATKEMTNETEERSRRQTTKVGTVVSDKMDKTVVVSVENIMKHPFYHKYVKKTSKFLAHDEENQCQEGDRVVIQESRPLSKKKRWSVREIVSRAS
ncbi:MAG: 30S ribosomal protein S17 [Thermoanaerobaculia bacterium]|nr:30S ribosomal protein S17 [Thermoanaerobaculia bacterium]